MFGVEGVHVIERYARRAMQDLWSDQHRYERWLTVELWAVEAWEKLGRLPEGVYQRLQGARVDADRVEEFEREYHHDVLAFLSAVSSTVDSDDAKYIHFGLTSTDVVDTALSSLTVEALDMILEDLDQLIEAVRLRALEHRHTPVMGRTHGIHAEPTSHGLKWALWWLELGRQKHRLEEARNQMAVMKLSGPVGNYASLPPAIEEHVAQRMGLQPAPLSTQVLQRDRHAEVILALALLASSLDKMATEIRHMQRTEVGELEEPFAEHQRGSSAMPHKRNPVKCEQISGLSRLLRGYVVPALEDIPLWHERDISHSSVERVMLPDATTLADYMLVQMTKIVSGITVRVDRMRENIEATGGLVFSGKVLLALVEAGLSRDEAYGVVQGHAMKAMADPTQTFRARLQQDPTVQRLLSEERFAALWDVEPYLDEVDNIYRRIGLDGQERRL